LVVRVRRKELIMGREVEATIYLPEDVLLTRERREKADKLDKALKTEIDKINEDFDQLDDQIKKKEIRKWRWLGNKINNLLKTNTVEKLIEDTDRDNYVIWPAIGQYLRDELKRGFEDTKRSGTKNDHYRKCYALATIPGTDWITSWVGWDAFTDRGDQLVYSKKLMHVMEKKFSKISPELSSKDYKLIAKLLVSYIPSKSKLPSNIDAMNEEELEKIVDSVYTEFIK
jgi:hypothetical protein